MLIYNVLYIIKMFIYIMSHIYNIWYILKENRDSYIEGYIKCLMYIKENKGTDIYIDLKKNEDVDIYNDMIYNTLHKILIDLNSF